MYEGIGSEFLRSWDHNSFIVGAESQRERKRGDLSLLSKSKTIETTGRKDTKNELA